MLPAVAPAVPRCSQLGVALLASSGVSATTASTTVTTKPQHDERAQPSAAW